MKKYIAYFDFLGFKEFIDNNDLENQKRSMGHIFREIEIALGQENVKEAPQGIIADLSKSKVNAINFSDTIVFFTNDDTKDSLIEILKVAFKFNWRTNGYVFPARGALVFGEIIYVPHSEKSEFNAVYNVNSVFGKGLVDAHIKAESQNWAGTVIDESFISQINELGLNHQDIIPKYAKKYKVPYKNISFHEEEYVLNFIEGHMDKAAFKNYSKGIERNFSEYNKSINHPSVKNKLENTVEFLKSYLK